MLSERETGMLKSRTPLALFLVSVLSIAGVALAAAQMRSAVRSSDDALAAAALELGETERLRSLRERVSRKARTFLLVGDDRFLDELYEAERDFGAMLRDRAAAADSVGEILLISRIEGGEKVRHRMTEELIAVRQTGAGTEAIAETLEDDLQPTLDALDAATADLVGYHQRKVEIARSVATQASSDAWLGLWLAGGLALVVAAFSSLALARTLRRLEGRAERFFELSLDMVCIANTDGYIKKLNPAFEEVLGYSRRELLARPFLALIHPDDRTSIEQELRAVATGKEARDYEVRMVCKDGTVRWLCWHAASDPDGEIYAVARDVTARRANDERLELVTSELRAMAVADELTGLHNRRGFHLLAQQALEQARTSGRRVVFFFADLDGLKRINDELGHQAGDRALRDAAQVLTAAFRATDVVARLGGDEFAILARDATPESTAGLEDRVQELVRENNARNAGRPFELAMSVGFTFAGADPDETVDAVLERADEEMYRQKMRRKAQASRAPSMRSESLAS